MFNRLKTFIVKQAAVDEEEITKEEIVESDLGLAGDDAVGLLIPFEKTFNVGVTKFMASDYFDGEGNAILPAIIRLFTGGKKRPNKMLTIGHLEKGILAGRLDEKVNGN